MRRLSSVVCEAAVCVSAFVFVGDTSAQSSFDDRPMRPPLGVSGDVEIRRIEIRRLVESDSPIEVDHTQMEVTLWLTSKVGPQALTTLLEFDELGPVEDDTGKLLSTPARIEHLRAFHDVHLDGSDATMRGKTGPTVEITLDAPARTATKLKSLRGKITVARPMNVELDFEVAKLDGKVLEHPLLKDLPIRPKITVKDDKTSLVLEVPRKHKRIVSWNLYVKKGDQLLRADEFVRTLGPTSLETNYLGDVTKGARLRLEILDPVETNTMEFEFKDVPLP